MINEEILGVCGNDNQIIYLININPRKVIKEVKFEDYIQIILVFQLY